MNAMIRIFVGAICLAAVFISGSLHAARLDGTRHQEWRGWSFDYQVSGDFDGVSLTDVKYQGVAILNKASLPVMRVFYDRDACGPYADRMGGDITPISWANNDALALREFTQSGRNWLEIGIQDTIGNYVIYQAWYLSADGIMDGHIFSKGLQCNIDHVHYPYWRMDFDVAGEQNDQIRRFANGNWQTLSTEFGDNVTSADNHRWQVIDTVSGDRVDIEFGAAGWDDIGGTVDPVNTFQNNRIFGRSFKRSEDEGWRYGARSEVPHDNNEDIDGRDILIWYKGDLPHSAAEGPDLWHSTGVRFIINLAGTNPDPNNNDPSIQFVADQTDQIDDNVNLQIDAQDSDGDTLSYSANGLPTGLSIDSEDGVISGTLTEADVTTTRITVNDGNGGTAEISFNWTVVAPDTNPTSVNFNFESGQQGWRINPDGTDSASTGRWERTDPQSSNSRGREMQPDDAAEGNFAFITDGRSDGYAGRYDIDGGDTTIISPEIDLSNASQINLSFSYFFAHLTNTNNDDYLRVTVIGENETMVAFEKRGNSSVVEVDWKTKNIDIGRFTGQTIQILVEVADSGSPSLVEAGIDNIVVNTQ
ncbi:MAG: Ig domain-containing protein [Methylococcales bacterium]